MANLLGTLITGNLRTTQGYGTSDSTRILYPGGGSFVTTTSTITGAIRIKMPVFGSGMMMTCTVKVYEYSTNKSFTITFGGHRDSANWYNEFCYIDGGTTRTNLTVRFGIDDGVNCVWIGETSSSWSYPQVFVTDAQLGFVGYSTSWLSGWAVDFVTAFGSVDRTQIAYAKITTANIGSQSVNYAVSAGTLTSINISQFTNDSGYLTSASVGNMTRLWAESHPDDYYVRANWTGSYWQLTSNHPSPVQVGYADNAGSAGNADTLDGLNSSVFVRNDVYNSADAGLQVFRNIGSIDGSWPSSDHTFGLENNDAGNIVVNFHRGGYTSHNLWYNGSQFRFDTVVSSTSDFRAPIFYDSADTAYYGDFASTSRMNAIVYDNLYFSGDQTYGFIGRNVYADTINGRGSDPLELNYYDGGSVIIGTGANGSKALYAGSLFSGGSAVITAANIGSQSVNYAASAGSAPNAGNINPFYNVTAGVGNGLRFWSGDDNYKISMGVGGLYQYGPVIDYSIKSQMDAGSTGRGFTWGNNGVTPVAALNATSGDFQVAGSIIAPTVYFGANSSKGRAQGFGTNSSSLHKIGYISFDWDAGYDSYQYHGIASTDYTGGFTDNISINSYNDITFRLDSNGNNGASYVRFMNDTTANNTFSSLGYDGSTYFAAFSRDLYIDGNRGGNFGNRLIIGGTTTPYTLQDANIRPTAYLRGAYPVLTLDHTETSNGSHGPTIQFVHNGSVTNNRQWVIGTNGTGTQLDFGYSDGANNANFNPHNGIGDHSGTTWMRLDSSGNITKVGSYQLRNGFSIGQGSSNYGVFNSWVRLDGSYGFYSGTNSAHIYPNNGSYGSWRMDGTRGSWNGIEFGASNGNVSLMVNPSSNTTGFHNNAYGWQFFWESGTLYCFKNTYGAGTQATVLDSVNFTSYAWPLEGSWKPASLSGSTRLRGATSPDGGEFGLAYSSGQIHPYADGFFYQNEGAYRVIDTNSVGSYAPTLTGGGASGSWGISVTGSAASAGRSSSLDIVGYGSGNMTYYQSSGTFAGYSGWAGYFVSNHGDGATYYNQTIIMPFWGPPQYSRLQGGGAIAGPYTFWSTENLNDYAPNMNQYVRTTDNVTFNTTTSPTILVNGHSDNTKGYRIHNTSGSSVSAMFTNSSNQLVIAAGAVDQINLNKKVYVNGVALGVNIAPSATAGRIDASNDIVAFSSSDERLKQNITPIANALDKVKSLTGVEFDWKPEHKEAHGHEGHDTGIIAQQVLGVMPTAVRTNDTGYLAVRYEKLIGLLIEANKELAARVEELEKKLG